MCEASFSLQSHEPTTPQLHRVMFHCVMCPNCTKLITAIPWVLSNKPVKCEVDRRNAFRGYVNVNTQNYGLNPNIKSGLLM